MNLLCHNKCEENMLQETPNFQEIKKRRNTPFSYCPYYDRKYI